MSRQLNTEIENCDNMLLWTIVRNEFLLQRWEIATHEHPEQPLEGYSPNAHIPIASKLRWLCSS
jgi:hypothetical protein